MKLFDTAQKRYVIFEPGKVVKIYVCGITPYDSAHLGHVFTFMTYDLLQRRLEDKGHVVQQVRNITDVDEPMYQKAKELGISYTKLADIEIKSFHEVLEELNFKPLFAEPLASQYIDEMAAAVQKLLERGFAYHVGQDVYYDVRKDSAFGEFSSYNERLRLTLSRARGGDPDRTEKRHPLDFLLWKSISDPKDPAQWPSPQGPGRPGWHLECSVMSKQLLGAPFDIHGGGTDLIFPHHECEIAQSLGLDKQEPARLWLHVSPLLYGGEKMSKSLGNLIFAKDLLKKFDFATMRIALMCYHHRIGGEWQDELLHYAKGLLHNVHTTTKTATKKQAEQLLQEVRAALDDDLNTLEVIDAFGRFNNVVNKDSAAKSDTLALITQTLDLLGLRPAV